MKTKTPTILPSLPVAGKRRLRKLIAFLQKLRPRQFDFSSVVNSGKHNGHTCGTVCCAVGWTPAVFPRKVKWHYDEYYESFELRAVGCAFSQSYAQTAERLFGMAWRQAYFLFAPFFQVNVHASLPECPANATPKQVAAMLEKYIALTETPKP